jgi:phage baseplate assembly protein W
MNRLSDTLSPSDVLHPGLDTGQATYVDVNPTYDPQTSPAILLTDTYAIVYGSLANLFACPQGGRSRIFQEDYWSGLYQLLQEPFDGQTANLLSLACKQAIDAWEPRIVNVVVNVTPDITIPGYLVGVTGDLIAAPKQKFSASYALSITT